MALITSPSQGVLPIVPGPATATALFDHYTALAGWELERGPGTTGETRASETYTLRRTADGMRVRLTYAGKEDGTFRLAHADTLGPEEK